MDKADELEIINICFQFTYENSRSRHDGNEKIARVVYFDKLVEHLYERDRDLFWEMGQEYKDLLNYLTNKGRYNVRKYNRDWDLWNYEIMPIHKYKNDLRHLHDYFSTLYEAKHEIRTPLVFVIYRKQDKIDYDAERSEVKQRAALARKRHLAIQMQEKESDKLITGYHNSKIDARSMRNREFIRNRMRNILYNLFPGVSLFVEIIGSTMTGLGNTESDLNICIRVSRPYLRQHVQDNNYRMVDLRKSPNTIFNMRYIALELRKQTRLRYIKAYINSHQPFVEFFDDNSTIPCTLSFDYGLGLETGRLIAEYVRLDKRVAPFIYSIKKFAQCQGIDDSNDGFLSSFAYTIMGLHFLIAGLVNPVLPCLQDYNEPCYAPNCYSLSDNNHMLFQKTGSLDESVDSSFHTCLEIKNNVTDQYAPSRQRNIFSEWESNNGLHLVTLLEAFFKYFSNENNFKQVSIIKERGQLVKTKNNNIWSGDYVVIQDPFLIKKNIGKKCLETSLEDIAKKFGHAANMLHEGTSFSDVCFL